MAKPESVKRMARLKRQKEREGAKDRRTKYNDDRPRELLAYVISWCEMAGQVKTKRLGWRNDYRKHVGLSTSTITKWRRTHPAFARAELEAYHVYRTWLCDLAADGDERLTLGKPDRLYQNRQIIIDQQITIPVLKYGYSYGALRYTATLDPRDLVDNSQYVTIKNRSGDR